MRKNYFYVDLIKITAISLVVLLHTAGIHLSQWNKVAFSDWMIENFYNSFTRMSVPLFIMISGAMLLQKEESYYDFFKKRLSKILIPSITWILFYLVWRIIFTGEALSKATMIKMIISGPVYYHLWYLYMIIGLYLVTPIIRKITLNSNKMELIYICTIWFIFTAIIPTLLNILKFKYKIDLQVGITLPLITGHIGYYILGHLLNQYKPKKSHIYLSWVVLIINWLFITLGTLYFTSLLGNFNDTFYSYFSPTVVFEALAGFVLLKYYGNLMEKNLSIKTKDFFSLLGTASFGVYLIHPLIRDILLRKHLYFSVDSLKINPLISNPLAAMEVAVISYLIVIAMLKIPILNLTVGGGISTKK